MIDFQLVIIKMLTTFDASQGHIEKMLNRL